MQQIRCHTIELPEVDQTEAPVGLTAEKDVLGDAQVRLHIQFLVYRTDTRGLRPVRRSQVDCLSVHPQQARIR
ncbi:MAG TPA: hypothetical protein PKX07_11770, partial [Aggregatilineales bacterium]|nr:hypothetical protein [Aggregatilineales bacterium]